MKKGLNTFRTVSSRLALWYAVLFAAASLFSFMAAYLMLSSTLSQRADEELLAELREFEMLYLSSNREVMRDVIMHEGESEGITRIFLRVTTPEDTLIASSDMGSWRDVPKPDAAPVTTEAVRFETFTSRDHPSGVRMAHLKMEDGSVITIGMTLEGDKAFLNAFTEISMTAMAVAIIAGSIMGWYVSRKAMLGFERVRFAASGIGREDTSTRVPLGEEGLEIQRLATTFNAMLDRIESLISELKDVTDNIAHELRSPLTRIRGIAESILTSDPDKQDSREMAAVIIEECDLLGGIINTMLEIAETDSGVAHLATERVDMGELLRKAHDLFLPVAEDKGISFELDIPGPGFFVTGDTIRLQRCMSNLLDNALKFTPEGGRVVISARDLSGRMEVAVADTGSGIEEEDLPHIFEKFFRSDKSRATPGNGLGLSLVQSVIKAHGGDISVSSARGQGTTFTVTLPASS